MATCDDDDDDDDSVVSVYDENPRRHDSNAPPSNGKDESVAAKDVNASCPSKDDVDDTAASVKCVYDDNDGKHASEEAYASSSAKVNSTSDDKFPARVPRVVHVESKDEHADSADNPRKSTSLEDITMNTKDRPSSFAPSSLTWWITAWMVIGAIASAIRHVAATLFLVFMFNVHAKSTSSVTTMLLQFGSMILRMAPSSQMIEAMTTLTLPILDSPLVWLLAATCVLIWAAGLFPSVSCEITHVSMSARAVARDVWIECCNWWSFRWIEMATPQVASITGWDERHDVAWLMTSSWAHDCQKAGLLALALPFFSLGAQAVCYVLSLLQIVHYIDFRLAIVVADLTRVLGKFEWGRKVVSVARRLCKKFSRWRKQQRRRFSCWLDHCCSHLAHTLYFVTRRPWRRQRKIKSVLWRIKIGDGKKKKKRKSKKTFRRNKIRPLKRNADISSSVSKDNETNDCDEPRIDPDDESSPKENSASSWWKRFFVHHGNTKQQGNKLNGAPNKPSGQESGGKQNAPSDHDCGQTKMEKRSQYWWPQAFWWKGFSIGRGNDKKTNDDNACDKPKNTPDEESSAEATDQRSSQSNNDRTASNHKKEGKSRRGSNGPWWKRFVFSFVLCLMGLQHSANAVDVLGVSLHESTSGAAAPRFSASSSTSPNMTAPGPASSASEQETDGNSSHGSRAVPEPTPNSHCYGDYRNDPGRMAAEPTVVTKQECFKAFYKKSKIKEQIDKAATPAEADQLRQLESILVEFLGDNVYQKGGGRSLRAAWKWKLSRLADDNAGLYAINWTLPEHMFKVGMSGRCRTRARLQKPYFAARLMTMEEICAAVPDEVVDRIEQLALPFLNYHPDHEGSKRDMIRMQLAEMAMACSHECLTDTVVEVLVALPSDRVRQIAVELGELVTPSIREFFHSSPTFFWIGTWTTLKLDLHRLLVEDPEGFLAFILKSRPLPPELFLKKYMFELFLGPLTDDMWEDAVKESPRLTQLKALAEELREILNSRTVSETEKEDLLQHALESIRDADYSHYVHPDDPDLAKCGKEVLKRRLDEGKLNRIIVMEKDLFEKLRTEESDFFQSTFRANERQILATEKPRGTDGLPARREHVQLLHTTCGHRVMVTPSLFPAFGETSTLQGRLNALEDTLVILQLFNGLGLVSSDVLDDCKRRFVTAAMGFEGLEQREDETDHINEDESEDIENEDQFDQPDEAALRTVKREFFERRVCLFRRRAFPNGWFLGAPSRVLQVSRSLKVGYLECIYLRHNLGRATFNNMLRLFGILRYGQTDTPLEEDFCCPGFPGYFFQDATCKPLKPVPCKHLQQTSFCSMGRYLGPELLFYNLLVSVHSKEVLVLRHKQSKMELTDWEKDRLQVLEEGVGLKDSTARLATRRNATARNRTIALYAIDSLPTLANQEKDDDANKKRPASAGRKRKLPSGAKNSVAKKRKQKSKNAGNTKLHVNHSKTERLANMQATHNFIRLVLQREDKDFMTEPSFWGTKDNPEPPPAIKLDDLPDEIDGIPTMKTLRRGGLESLLKLVNRKVVRSETNNADKADLDALRQLLQQYLCPNESPKDIGVTVRITLSVLEKTKGSKKKKAETEDNVLNGRMRRHRFVVERLIYPTIYEQGPLIVKREQHDFFMAKNTGLFDYSTVGNDIGGIPVLKIQFSWFKSILQDVNGKRSRKREKDPRKMLALRAAFDQFIPLRDENDQHSNPQKGLWRQFGFEEIPGAKNVDGLTHFRFIAK